MCDSPRRSRVYIGVPVLCCAAASCGGGRHTCHATSFRNGSELFMCLPRLTDGIMQTPCVGRSLRSSACSRSSQICAPLPIHPLTCRLFAGICRRLISARVQHHLCTTLATVAA